jgi:hypothetical protein
LAKLGEKLWYITHSFGGSYLAEQPTVLNNVYNKLREQTERDGMPMPTVIGCGHLHTLVVEPQIIKQGAYEDRYGFIMPCMKLGDSFLSRGPIPIFSRVGYMSLEQEYKELRGRHWKVYRPHLEQ